MKTKLVKKLVLLSIVVLVLSYSRVRADLILSDQFNDPALTGWTQLTDPTMNQVVWETSIDGGEITARDEYPTGSAYAGFLTSNLIAQSLSFDAVARLEQNLTGNQSDYVTIGIADVDYLNTYQVQYGQYAGSNVIMRLIKRSNLFATPSPTFAILIETVVPYDTSYHTIGASRDNAGNWTMAFDGSSVGTAFDSQWIDFSSVYLGINTRGGYITEVNFLALVGPVPAIIDLDPDTLNLNSKGKWITCYIEPPEGYDVSDIDVGSILLEGLLEVQRSDVQDDVLMAKFDRQDVITYIEFVLGITPPDDVTLMITGELTNGTTFEGSDTIRVIDKDKK